MSYLGRSLVCLLLILILLLLLLFGCGASSPQTPGSSMPFKKHFKIRAVLGLFTHFRNYLQLSSRDKTCLHALDSKLDGETELANDNTLAPSSETQAGTGESLLRELTLPNTVFFVFDNLPIELRRKVWAYALPDPRIVKYAAKNRRELITPLIHVSREARAEFFLYYKPLVSVDGSIFYMDPRKDTLFINDLHFFTEKLDYGINATILAKLRHIVYPMKKLEDLIQWPNYIIREREPGRPRNFTMHAAAHFIKHLMDFNSFETLTLAVVAPHDGQRGFSLAELFTMPISQWPAREDNVEFTADQRQALTTSVLANWNGESYLLEELQKAYHDTVKAMREVLDSGEPGHAFEVEIKGLIEPVGSSDDVRSG